MLRTRALLVLPLAIGCSSLREGAFDDAGVTAPASDAASSRAPAPIDDAGADGPASDGSSSPDATAPPRDGGADATTGDTGPSDSAPLDSGPADASGNDSATQGSKVESATVGDNVACVVFEFGALRCWGDYRLASGGSTATRPPSPIPYKPTALDAGTNYVTDVAEVSATYRHACARLLDGTFACWGFNNEYQLGDLTRNSSPNTTDTPFARIVQDPSTAGPNLRGPVSERALGRVSAGVSYSGAIVGGGVIYTWGYISGDTNFVLGRTVSSSTDGMSPKPVLAPVPGPAAGDVDRLIGATEVSLGRTHACALVPGSKAVCWGDNLSGKLGIGSGIDVPDPRPRSVQVPDSVALVKLSVGAYSACGVTGMGRVRCWGQNNLGQAGKEPVGSYLADASLDVTLLTTDGTTKYLEHVIDVGVGESFACALTDAAFGGLVYCWGAASASQLGDGTTTARGKAGPVASELAPLKKDLQGARFLAVGKSSACVVLGARDVRCWGRGPIGERGQSSSMSTIPRPVDDL